MTELRSYTSQATDPLDFLAEVLTLYKRYSGDLSERVAAAIADARRVEVRVTGRYAKEIRGLDLLEIGPGQFLSQTAYFARSNRVVAIDLDVIVRGVRPLAYLKMLRANGVRRTIKTLGRKLAGIDYRYASELRRQLNLERLPHLEVREMDTCQMSFSDHSFDLVYSRSVFHHLPKPEAAMDEIARVLRPGGVAYISLHLYSSPTGCLDPRVFTERRDELGYWPHLRPQLQRTIRSSAYLNKLRLAEWRELFARHWPGCQTETTPSSNEKLEAAARSLQRGELQGYTLEELLSHELVAMWRKDSDVRHLESERGS